MKSEKARQDFNLLSRQLGWSEFNDLKFGCKNPEDSRAFCISAEIKRLIELAESEMRYKAVEAYMKTCDNYKCGECDIAYGIEELKPCADNGLCGGIERFKQTLDELTEK